MSVAVVNGFNGTRANVVIIGSVNTVANKGKVR